MMYNLKAMFKKKAESPVGEKIIPAVGKVELDGNSWLVDDNWIKVTAVSNPVELKSWTSNKVVRSFDASYITYTFNVQKKPEYPGCNTVKPGKYSIVKFWTKDDVHVLADVTLTYDDELNFVAKTDRVIYVLAGPLFDFGFDYEEAELARIAWEAEQQKKRETERHLAELILNLLDDHADTDDDLIINNDYGLHSVKVRGIFDFETIGEVLNSANEDMDNLDFSRMFAKSFADNQTNEHVQLVDSECLWSVDVYGGEYDLVAVARDVINYIENKKEEN